MQPTDKTPAVSPRSIPRDQHNVSRKDVSPNALRVLYRLREAGFGAYLVGGAIGLGYVPCRPGETAADILASDYAIDVAGRIVAAEASLTPLYDPTSARVQA